MPNHTFCGVSDVLNSV